MARKKIIMQQEEDQRRGAILGARHNSSEEEEINLLETRVKLYKRRWYMLLLFATYSGFNAFQWIQYPIISDIVSRFYGIPLEAVDWMSLIFMIVYIPLIFPVTWFLDRFGLRAVAVLGSLLGAVGAGMKVIACQPHLYPVAILGQVVTAVGNSFILGMPSKLAATWFGSKEVSTACSIGVFGNQIGIAFGFFIPPLMVPESSPDVESNLRSLFLMTTTCSLVLVVLVCLTFEKAPLVPPSRAQAIFLQQEGRSESYIQSIRSLLTSVPSLLLITSYGINTGAFYAIGTLLNTEIVGKFPGDSKFAGIIGLILVLSGVAGSIVCGIVLDRTRAYKKTTIAVYVATFVSMVIYTATLDIRSYFVVYVAAILLGFTMTGYLPVGFEFAAEITHPISEGTSSGMLNASAQIFGITMTLLMRNLQTNYSTLLANLLLCFAILVGLLLTLAVEEDLKRQRANSDHHQRALVPSRSSSSVGSVQDQESAPARGGKAVTR